MKATKLSLFAALGLAAMFTACNHHEDENPTGSWISAAPQTVTAQIADASSATKTLALQFDAAQGDQPGVVTLTADYDLTATDSVAANYAIKATIKGTWTRNGDEHDEYLLTFDKNTLSVTGTDAPVLGPVTDDFMASLSQFTAIEDVEVSKDGKNMTFETGQPEVKYVFVAR